jgi:hypothetical protein
MRLKKKHIAAIALSVAICVGATGCKSEEIKNTVAFSSESRIPPEEKVSSCQ